MSVTRVCSLCAKAKSVNGVWYLVATSGPSLFVCGSCYGEPREISAPVPV